MSEGFTEAGIEFGAKQFDIGHGPSLPPGCDSFGEFARLLSSRAGKWATRGSWLVSSAGAIDIAAMADTDHLNHQASVENLVEDPEVADAHSIDRVLSCESDTAGRPGFLSQ